jgi:formate dehydrogenase major subunit
MSKLNIIINKRIVQGFSGESILELARRHQIDIPTLCNDERLEPFSSCYLCVVEVEGMRGLQPACSTKISEGMRILTDNERVKKSRKFSLDLMVSNHYADCVAPCRETCPAGVDVQGYIAMINRGMHHEAVRLIKQTNPLPAICGRVCVRPCELACRRNLVEGVGVGIDYLKRYTADIDMNSPSRFIPEKKAASGKKAAVIGAGPGGLTAAYYLALQGHQADIFEASPHAGGMLRYGIPPYRLPNDVIDKEVEGITALGVKIHFNQKLGENLSYGQIKEKYDAVVLGIGSQNGTRIGCENDDAGHIFSGIDFLRNMEMTGQKYDFTGKTVAVIGGGNTAMDCCRTAMRCGAKEVIVLYRRTEKEMPANPIEIHESKLEGIKYMFLTAPAKVNPDAEGNVSSITCFKMQLGEPDASGRRRPVKVEDSEFDVQADFILAAIGQKTNVNFINDISEHAGKELILNKWGDIDAKAGTLQTSIENVFACGDGVTGPATLIEAIAQGKLAAHSCNLYLQDKEILPPEKEFLSRKDNFEEQKQQDYEAYFEKQPREEMPTLDPRIRHNFNEVELGYKDEAALKETLRCLECGCSELHTCDLKKHATTYKADQATFAGEYKKYHIRFDHPYIEIDNNKCILCSRCVRICSEVVGADALGLVNRGFDTYVAPSMEGSLLDTPCESCGMCIDTCPTGAITENISFKPAPVPAEEIKTICNYCSVGCEISLHHQAGFFVRTTGSKGMINKDGSICRFPKFGYSYLNDKERITHPLIKANGRFEEISFEKAFRLMAEKITSVEADQNAFYAGARLTNEEIYLTQKLARAGAGTNNVSSFHYMGRENGYDKTEPARLSIDQIHRASRIVLFASETNMEHAVPGYYAYARHHKYGTPIDLITTLDQSAMERKATRVFKIKSYYHFVKAAIYYVLHNKLENRVFLKDHCQGLEEYSKQVLSQSYQDLLKACGCTHEQIEGFVEPFNKEPHAVLLYAETNLGSNTCRELHHLSMLLGKTGKTASGLIALKEKNNSQGLFDMGGVPHLVPGRQPVENQLVRDRLNSLWGNSRTPSAINDQWQLLQKGMVKNAFLFGEDPLGCAADKQEIGSLLDNIDFLVVQDVFMSETAAEADLILPASLPVESGGSFTNTHQFIQQFAAGAECKSGLTTIEQLNGVMNELGVTTSGPDPADALLEAASLLNSKQNEETEKCHLELTEQDDYIRRFKHGCDHLLKRFDIQWSKAINHKNAQI